MFRPKTVFGIKNPKNAIRITKLLKGLRKGKLVEVTQEDLDRIKSILETTDKERYPDMSISYIEVGDKMYLLGIGGNTAQQAWGVVKKHHDLMRSHTPQEIIIRRPIAFFPSFR